MSTPLPYMDWSTFVARIETSAVGLPGAIEVARRLCNLRCTRLSELSSVDAAGRQKFLEELEKMPAPEEPAAYAGEGSLTSIDDGLPSRHAYQHGDVPEQQRREIERRVGEVRNHVRKMRDPEQWWR